MGVGAIPPKPEDFKYYIMKEITLSRDLKAQVDDEDYDYINKWKWSAMPRGKNFYAIRIKKINGKNKTFLMHREIIKNIPEGKEIDHVDRNGLNNQKSNLRIVDHRENLKNSRNRNFSKKYSLRRIGKEWILIFMPFSDNPAILGKFFSKTEALSFLKVHKSANFNTSTQILTHF